MTKPSLRLTKDMILRMCQVTLKEASPVPIHKEKVLIVDDEIYGRVDFPWSFVLGRGQKLKFLGYGEVQVLEATVDTLKCTQQIDERLCDEFTRNPPEPDPLPDVLSPRLGEFPAELLLPGATGSLADIIAAAKAAGVQARTCRVSEREVSGGGSKDRDSPGQNSGRAYRSGSRTRGL